MKVEEMERRRKVRGDMRDRQRHGSEKEEMKEIKQERKIERKFKNR